jgi:hypothetical protein
VVCGGGIQRLGKERGRVRDGKTNKGNRCAEVGGDDRRARNIEKWAKQDSRPESPGRLIVQEICEAQVRGSELEYEAVLARV